MKAVSLKRSIKFINSSRGTWGERKRGDTNCQYQKQKRSSSLLICQTVNEKEEYYKQLYVHKCYNLNNKDHSLKHKLPKFIQEDTDNMNKPTYINEIELIINKLQKNLTSMLLLVNYAQYLRKNIPHTLFQKIKLGGILSNSFSEDSIIFL